MKALVYTNPKHVDYRDVPEPDPHGDEVVIQIGAVGICGSDMHAYLGHDERRPPPLILGHEAAGIAKSGRYQGQQVVINPLVTCGQCPACQSGRSNICASREIISMAPRQGAFAEMIAMPERNLLPVPEKLDTATAALTEPIATGWHGVVKGAKALHRPLVESRALVFGGGAVGLSAALSLYAQGCRDIALAETNPARRKTAQSAKICQVYNPLSDGGPEENSIDLVVDCVGAKPTRQAATAAIKPGGVIVHVGLLDGADGMDVRKMTLQEVTFMGSYTYTMDDFRGTLEAMASGALGDLSWFEERDLAAGAGAFADLLEGRTGAAKIILRPQAGG